MGIKAFTFSVAAALAGTSAHAITVDMVDVVSGGPTITDSVLGGFFPGAGGAANGIGFGNGSTTAANLLITASFLGGANQFTALNSPIPTSYLLGNFEDAVDSVGEIQVLYATSGGSAAANFGDYFLMTISDVSIADGALTAFTPTPFLNATILVEAAELKVVNEIPLPASGLLLLAGAGGLLIARRRSA